MDPSVGQSCICTPALSCLVECYTKVHHVLERCNHLHEDMTASAITSELHTYIDVIDTSLPDEKDGRVRRHLFPVNFVPSGKYHHVRQLTLRTPSSRGHVRRTCRAPSRQLSTMRSLQASASKLLECVTVRRSVVLDRALGEYSSICVPPDAPLFKSSRTSHLTPPAPQFFSRLSVPLSGRRNRGGEEGDETKVRMHRSLLGGAMARPRSSYRTAFSRRDCRRRCGVFFVGSSFLKKLFCSFARRASVATCYSDGRPGNTAFRTRRERG